MYRDVQFRSRVEAKWAAFFDLVDWPWDYEPFDLNGYIPDFALRFHKPLLVEVKADSPEVDEAKSKIECSGWEGEALVLSGTWPNRESCFFSMPSIGWLAEWDGEHLCWDEAVMFECLLCGKASVLHSSASWSCRACGRSEGNGHISPCEKVDPHKAWARAGNIVQWRRAG